MKYKLSYTGSLRTEMIHEGSGAEIHSDAPRDNHGKGEAFSPTDLCAVSLASCMITVMGIHANKMGWEDFDVDGTAEKIMQKSPRRIERISIELSVTLNSEINTVQNQKSLMRAAEGCPVALSLHPDIVQELNIQFKNY
jgi:uncharacterized OsmC-like protein